MLLDERTEYPGSWPRKKQEKYSQIICYLNKKFRDWKEVHMQLSNLQIASKTPQLNETWRTHLQTLISKIATIIYSKEMPVYAYKDTLKGARNEHLLSS